MIKAQTALRQNALRTGFPLPLPVLMANGKLLIVGLRQFGDETGGTLETAAVAAGHAEQWKRKEQLVLRAGGRDVEQSPLFFQALKIIERTREREHSIAQADHKYRFPFLPFRLVHGAQAHVLRLVVGQ